MRKTIDKLLILRPAQGTTLSDGLYRQLFEKSLTVQLLISPETGHILSANPAACAFYGYDRDALENLSVLDINTLTSAQIKAEMQRAKKEERNFFNFKHCLSSGEERNVEVYSTPIQFSQDTLLHSIIIDVTERVVLKRHIEDTQAVLSHLVEQTNSSIMLVTKQASLPHHGNLSEREYEAMLLFAGGLKTQDVADRMHLSESTVRTYRSRLYKKMGFANDADLVRYAADHRLLK